MNCGAISTFYDEIETKRPALTFERWPIFIKNGKKNSRFSIRRFI